MTLLTRWDPLSDLATMQKSINRFVRESYSPEGPEECRWRPDQHLLWSRGLCNCHGSGQRAISTGLARCQWKLRAPPASTGFMKLLLAVFQFAFGCRPRHLSRVFTIKHHTYRVCFDCGREFDLPDALGAGPPDASRVTRLKNLHHAR
jgi:hypothetical protein